MIRGRGKKRSLRDADSLSCGGVGAQMGSLVWHAAHGAVLVMMSSYGLQCRRLGRPWLQLQLSRAFPTSISSGKGFSIASNVMMMLRIDTDDHIHYETVPAECSLFTSLGYIHYGSRWQRHQCNAGAVSVSSGFVVRGPRTHTGSAPRTKTCTEHHRSHPYPLHNPMAGKSFRAS